jgi:His/Glu/Gln/Arg/opine family amino acid ABC transporter permease subunit
MTLTQYLLNLLPGLRVTLQLCLIVWVVGIIVGTVFGVLAARLPASLGRITKFSFLVTSAVPILVTLFWMHYPLQEMLGVVIPPFVTASATLSIVNAVFVAELVRVAIVEFPTQYIEAAKVCGLGHRTTLLRVQLPILFRLLVPPLLLVQITMLQATLFASLISVNEVFRVAQRINSLDYQPIAIYTALALLFLVICGPLHLIAGYMKRKYSRDFSER